MAWTGTPPAGDIDMIRERISALRAERVAVDSAPVAEAEAAAVVDQMLTRWAGPQPSWHGPEALAAACAAGHPPTIDLSAPASLGQTLSLLAPLLRPLLRAAVLEALHQHYVDNPPGLASQARVAKLKALDSELFRCERDEENAIMAARAGGFTVERRPDADVRAVLGLD